MKQTNTPITILAIDDEPDNIRIIRDFLEFDEQQDYIVYTAENGKAGIEQLTRHRNDIQVILLDRMMPEMDGMAVLAALRASPQYSGIPVIMQTACSSHEQITEGIEAGVYYYLTKPYEPEMMLAIIKAAASDKSRLDAMRAELREYQDIVGLFTQFKAKFQTLDQASTLAAFLATAFPEPDKALLGLSELMINAVEHGNLEVGYDRKTELLSNNEWESEIIRLAQDPAHAHKWASVQFRKNGEQIYLKIEDQGQGFNWKPYLQIDPDRATHSHGRGVALSKLVGFDALEFEGKGNIVHCRTHINSALADAA